MPLKAFVFDILYKDGAPLIDMPMVERMKILEETIKPDDILMLTANHIVRDAETLSLLFDEAISKGLEGVVVKKLESPYEAGARNFNWVKLKRHSAGALNDTIDCVLLGYIFGRTCSLQLRKLELVYLMKNGEVSGSAPKDWSSITSRPASHR